VKAILERRPKVPHTSEKLNPRQKKPECDPDNSGAKCPTHKIEETE
jgi:hypothetical protein